MLSTGFVEDATDNGLTYQPLNLSLFWVQRINLVFAVIPDDGSNASLLSLLNRFLLDGIPIKVIGYRHITLLHGLMASRYREGYAFTTASMG
jgi:hypothetical protein